MTVILIPVYNDWKELEQLLAALRASVVNKSDAFELLIVNDGSTEEYSNFSRLPFRTCLVNVKYNLGHQKAIAIGLSYLYNTGKFDRVLIMDADGDDRPEDASRLLQEHEGNPTCAVVGRRSQRKEKGLKRLLYFAYLRGFRMLTGKSIRSGNFCVLPYSGVKELIFKGDIWLHLAGGIVKSRVAVRSIDTIKGDRYDGVSKMNFRALVYHGMAALATFIDIIAVRLLVGSIFAVVISILALIGILIIKTSTNLGIPGWASTLGGTIVVIILLFFLIALFLIFSFLSSQSHHKLIPGIHYADFIDNVQSHNDGH